MHENGEKVDLENCANCGCVMDVSAQPPFGHVVCPECAVEGHVKCDVGNYTILSKQGTGGMSLVFAAEDKTLGRKAAIKLLNETYSNDEKRILEFEKEAKITASISHPNVVRVFTVGKAFGRYFIAMELIDGMSLEQLMHREGALDEKKATRLALETVEGLKSAHGAGLIHRDIKPGNILLDAQGRAKIVDFGLALVTQGGIAIAEEIWATPYYVSPETLQLKEEDLRSDIYALGATLYHALSGVAPFLTESRSTSEFIKLKATIPKLGSVAGAVSSYLCEVVDKMMAYAAEDRYQSYDELLHDLRKVDSFQRTGNEALFTANQQQETGKKNIVKYGALCAGLVISAAVGWMYFSKNVQGDQSPVSNEVERPAELEQSDEAGQKAVLAAELRNAMNLFKGGNYRAAHQQYQALTQDKNLEYETALWAGLQSALSAWVSGDATLAQSALDTLQSRVSKQPNAESATELVLVRGIKKLQQNEAEDDFQHSITHGSVGVQIQLAVALKEWQLGNWQPAKNHFARVVSAAAQLDQDDAQVYSDIAERYLHDAMLLEQYQQEAKMDSLSAVQSSRSLLKQMTGEVQTKGMLVARLEMMREQLNSVARNFKELEAREKQQEQQRIRKEQKRWRVAKRRAQTAFDRHYYSDVAGLLQESRPLNESGEKWRDKTLYVSQILIELFEVTHLSLKDKSADFTILRTDGKGSYDKLLGASEKGLIVSLNDLPSEVLRWHELSPKTMIELHAKLKVNSLDAEEKLKRMEQLTIYAWRFGINDKAEAWSKTLISEVPEFAEKWQAIQQEDY